MSEIDLEITYHKNQQKFLFETDKRFRIIAKGRRFGLTKGMAYYVIEKMLDGVAPILWVDTTYSNIERYVERYFLPTLKKLPKRMWKYRANRNDLKVLNSVCDFRSADKPENIEGFGYELVILNEAGIILKNRRLWEESIRPMIMDYKADVIIGGTPKGKNIRGKNEKHLFYELYEKGLDENEKNWKSFNFSSYDNPLIDADEIDELAKEISAILRDQEIYGLFTDKETSGIIKREWWKYYNDYELSQIRFIKRVQSWDTAFKKNEENDYSVCTTWEIRQNGYYLIDIWRDRVEFPELKRNAERLFELHKPSEILIEDKASGQSLIQELQRNTRLPIKPIKISDDKIARVNSITPLIENGRVFIPNSMSKEKKEMILSECEEFPNSEHDDIVDSISQLLNETKGKDKPNLESIVHDKRNNFAKMRLRRKLKTYSYNKTIRG